MKFVSRLFVVLLSVGIMFAHGDDHDDWFEFHADGVGVLQGSPGYVNSGNEDAIVNGSFTFHLDANVRPWKSGRFGIEVESGYGRGINNDIQTFSRLNPAIPHSEFYIEQLWYQHTFADVLKIRAGKIDLTTDFDKNVVANNKFNQFLSHVFVNNVGVGFPYHGGYGAMVKFQANHLVDIGAGIVDEELDNWFKNPLVIGEIGFKPEIADRHGNYRFYAWHSKYSHSCDSDHDHHHEIDPHFGFGLSLDQEITDNVFVFARYGIRNGDHVELTHSWSTGLNISGIIPKRQRDVLGMAYSQVITDHLNNEHQFETYYNFKTSKYTNITPNAQWVKYPGGDGGSSWIFGIRARFHIHQGTSD